MHRNYQRGQAVITSVVFFLFISLSLVLGISSVAVRELRVAEQVLESKQGFFAAESGAEDITYRFKKGKQVGASETLSVGGAIATTTVTDVGGGQKDVLSVGDLSSYIRKVRTELTVSSSGASFSFGVQAGDGGFKLENTSSVVGNVYSNGPVVGAGSNVIKGDVVSAGSSGSISSIHATSSAYAHTIKDSTIDKDAHYQVLTNTNVGGVKYPGSADQPKAELAISDAMVAAWESAAAAGGTIASPCPYRITSNITIGPKKIVCNLEISGTPTVTLTGPLWVVGNIDIKNSAIVRISSSLGNKSVAIIADDPGNRTTSSKITLQNSATFVGTGGSASYILLLSQNNSSEIGGSEEAVNVKNTVEGDLLVYAGHGNIVLQNNISLNEVSAYKITVKNSAQVVYKSGLASLLFSSGPSGSFDIGSWREVR